MTLSTQPGEDSALCPLVEAPSPRPTVAGGTPVPPDTDEPSPGRTPARSASPLEPGEWTVYRSLEGSPFHETGLRHAVIRDQENWTCFWRIHSGGGVLFHPIDFEEEVILVLTLGPQATTGHAIRPLGIDDTPEGYVLRYEHIAPGPRCELDDGFRHAPAPTLLIRHRPDDPRHDHGFADAGQRVWDCFPVGDTVRSGDPVAHEVVGNHRHTSSQFLGFRVPTVLLFDEPVPWHPYSRAIFGDQRIDPDRFATERLVVATLGYRPSTGYDLEPVSLHAHDGTLQLRLEETAPGEGCVVGGAVTTPFLFIWVERTDASDADVAAALETNQVDCSQDAPSSP